MADIISRPRQSNGRAGSDRRNWSLILGIVASVLAVTYLFVGLHARYGVNTTPGSASGSSWFPLQLFVIAIAPALAGFIFLWSERHLQSRATQKFLRNLGIFWFGMVLAAWVAFC
jgi:hypothetical protein